MDIPLHTIVKLTSYGYKYKVEMINMHVECVDTHRKQPVVRYYQSLFAVPFTSYRETTERKRSAVLFCFVFGRVNTIDLDPIRKETRKQEVFKSMLRPSKVVLIIMCD